MKSQCKTENETRETTSEEKGPEMGSCCPESAAAMMARCCEGFSAEGSEGMQAMMFKCAKGMKVCRWFSLIPVGLGVIAFLPGYFLGAEIVRILWLIVSGTLVLLGLLGLLLMGSMRRA